MDPLGYTAAAWDLETVRVSGAADAERHVARPVKVWQQRLCLIARCAVLTFLSHLAFALAQVTHAIRTTIVAWNTGYIPMRDE